MFTAVRIRDFRGHEDTTVPLSRFTVLVGGNGVGKTSVLEAIAWLSRAVGLSYAAEPRAPDAVLRQGGAAPEVSLRYDSPEGTIEVRHEPRQGMVAPSPPRVPGDACALTLMLSPHRVGEASPLTKTTPSPDGFGTPSTLANLKLNETQRFDRLLARLRRIVPSVTDLYLPPARVREVAKITGNAQGGFDTTTRGEGGYGLGVSFETAQRVPATAVSEGTLLALGALALIEAHEGVRLLLIDDLDRALHIEAQAQYVAVLREVLRDDPTLQIVATTHSPLVVEHFNDDEVVVLGRSREHRVVAKPLSAHPKRDKIRSLSAGEFWVAELEHWVAP